MICKRTGVGREQRFRALGAQVWEEGGLDQQPLKPAASFPFSSKVWWRPQWAIKRALPSSFTLTPYSIFTIFPIWTFFNFSISVSWGLQLKLKGSGGLVPISTLISVIWMEVLLITKETKMTKQRSSCSATLVGSDEKGNKKDLDECSCCWIC